MNEFHERLNTALNRSVTRMERRAQRNDSIQDIRLQRQSRSQVETLLALAREHADHFAFHP